MPAIDGAAIDISEISFGETAIKSGGSRAWDHQQCEYSVRGGKANVVLSRLTPAVLVDSAGSMVKLSGHFTHVAMVAGNRPVVFDAKSLGDPVRMDEPWLLAWFEKGTQYRGYLAVVDHEDQHFGTDKRRLSQCQPMFLDMPILIRLEHRPASISLSDGLELTFAGPAGKVAIMPAFGAKVFDPAETAQWNQTLPSGVVKQCRTWSRVLRDYPLTLAETYRVEPSGDAVVVTQALHWMSFDDDWGTPVVKAAPVPPMLGLALKGGMPITFAANGKPVMPVDFALMDTPGLAMGVEGTDEYHYRVSGLNELLEVAKKKPPTAGEAKCLQDKLIGHVQEMVDAGHLQPLLYIYGGLGGTAPAYYYWGNSAELAEALVSAWPYLPEQLETKALSHLKNEWAAYPPLKNNVKNYREGVNRAPYEIPYGLIDREIRAVEDREGAILQWHRLATCMVWRPFCT